MTKIARNYSCELAESKILLVCFKVLSLRTAEGINKSCFSQYFPFCMCFIPFLNFFCILKG